MSTICHQLTPPDEVSDLWKMNFIEMRSGWWRQFKWWWCPKMGVCLVSNLHVWIHNSEGLLHSFKECKHDAAVPRKPPFPSLFSSHHINPTIRCIKSMHKSISNHNILWTHYRKTTQNKTPFNTETALLWIRAEVLLIDFRWGSTQRFWIILKDFYEILTNFR